MNDLMRCLYHFALETHMEPIAEDREYRAGLDAITAQEDRVRAGMDEEQRRALKLLLDRVSDQNAMENERVFCAALRLARELNALVSAQPSFAHRTF